MTVLIANNSSNIILMLQEGWFIARQRNCMSRVAKNLQLLQMNLSPELMCILSFLRTAKV